MQLPQFTDIAASALVRCAVAFDSRKGADICLALYEMRKNLSARTCNVVLVEMGYDGLVEEALEFFDVMQVRKLAAALQHPLGTNASMLFDGD